MGPVDQTTTGKRTRPLVAPLENGDRLGRVEFERRYEAMPQKVKAELIDGVVYMTPPTKHEHGRPHGLVVTWLGVYASETPGVEMIPDATLRLDEVSEPQPDALLRILPECGGTSRVDEDGYLHGGVELVVEVAASSASFDLHQKKSVYQRHACREYAVVVVREEEVRWLALEDSDYVLLAADAAGVVRSRVFPGLWLDTGALLAGDAARLLAVLREGLASSEHAAFVKTLAARKTAPPPR